MPRSRADWDGRKDEVVQKDNNHGLKKKPKNDG